MKTGNAGGRMNRSKKSGSAGEHPASGMASPHAFSSQSLSRILVPLDFSECSLGALQYAAWFARRLHLKLILLHVVEPAVYQDNYFGISSAAEQANRKLVEAARKQLTAVAKQSLSPDVEIEALVRIGHPHSEIPETARALGADLLVLGTHGSAALHPFSMGSTAERVVRVAPCPVLTVPGARVPSASPNSLKDARA